MSMMLRDVRSTLFAHLRLSYPVFCPVWVLTFVLSFPSSSAAQTAASFFSQIDEQGDVEAASHCQRTFSNALLAAGLVERPSTEVQTLMRECVEDRSNPGFVRECDLSAARGEVNYVVLVGAQRDAEDWLFYVQALSPMLDGAVWQSDDLVASPTALRGARESCAFLAADFLFHQEFVSVPAQRTMNGDEGVSGDTAVTQEILPAVVHVVAVAPSPADLYVNGRGAGVAPGQFEVPADIPTNIEVRSPGYESWSTTVTVPAGSIGRVASIVLQPLPATLDVTANVQGADIIIDGSVVGTTILNRAVSVIVPAGTRQLQVRLAGFDDYQSSVALAPGGTQTLVTTLRADDSRRVTPSGAGSFVGALEGFVHIAPGTFLMGSPIDEEGRDDDEMQHLVTLTRGFYLQSTEVTQADWQRILGTNPSYFSDCGPDCPVERVSWWDAVWFANARSRSEGLEECYLLQGCVGEPGTGLVSGDHAPLFGPGDFECDSATFVGLDCGGYRLPTEAEWECAARSGTHDLRYGLLNQIAWYGGNSVERTNRVALLVPNSWGFFDMIGNVWEWTHDRYGDVSPDAVDPTGPNRGSTGVVRGGDWTVTDEFSHFARAANRYSRGLSRRSYTFGFRLARTAP
jgi:formylglycine-generating enzyme required for sulfatase activity